MEERMPVQGPPHRVAPAPQWHAGTRQPLEVQDAGPMDSTRPGALQALQTTEPTLFQPCQPQSPLWLPPAPLWERAPQDTCLLGDHGGSCTPVSSAPLGNSHFGKHLVPTLLTRSGGGHM